MADQSSSKEVNGKPTIASGEFEVVLLAKEKPAMIEKVVGLLAKNTNVVFKFRIMVDYNAAVDLN